jgi:hypothetical protein
MDYPLHLSFKILALAPQISIADQAQRPVMYVRQKLFKFKEAVQVFRDESQSQHLFDINADRIIDWSARYTFSSTQGQVLGAVKRSGMRSLFAAHYTILDAQDQPVFEIEQLNPWVGVVDGLFEQIPIVSIFSGYIFNPTYAVFRPGQKEAPVMNLVKKRTLLDTGFAIHATGAPITPAEEGLVLLSAITVTLLERDRS